MKKDKLLRVIHAYVTEQGYSIEPTNENNHIEITFEGVIHQHFLIDVIPLLFEHRIEFYITGNTEGDPVLILATQFEA